MASINKFHAQDCPKDNACECPWRLNYRPMGVRGPHKRLNFPTRKAAEKFLAETAVKVSRGEYIDSAKVPTFAEAAERWFASKTDRRPSHVLNLRQRLDKHILPALGAERLDRITVVTIEEFRNKLRAQGYARRTIGTIVRMVSAIFAGAIRRGEATQNPCARLERSFEAARELKGNEHAERVSPESILSPEQIPALLDAAPAGWQRALILTAYLTGMRCGELLALRWADTDLANGKLHVRRSLTWADGRPRFFPPKTKAGTRTISIAPGLVSALKVWKLAAPVSPLDLVFPDEVGEPLDKDRTLHALHAALRRARLSKVNFHSLRHSCASAMIAAGVPITEIQHRLGHSSAAVTLGVYSHFFKNTETDTAAKLEAAVLGETGHKVSTGPAQIRRIA